MAESQSAPKLMLNPREKLTGALVIGIAFATFVATLVVTAIFAVPEMTKPPPGDYYLDIVKEDKCSTCWEATVFATSSDPFYQWISDSSLPDDLNISQRGTLAYQRASIWRVKGNTTSTNESSLYSSPDPHILGGEFVKRSRTLVWKTTVYWGMSVKICLDSCLSTTPIVQTAPGSYAVLLVGVPYKMASENTYGVESSDLYLDNSAVYLTNFMSNASWIESQKLWQRNQELRLRRPASNEDGILPLKLNASGCGQGNSFCDYDYPLEEKRTRLYSYSPRRNTSIQLDVNFSTNFEEAIRGPNQILKDFVSCTEDTIQKKDPSDGTLDSDLQECWKSPIVAVGPVIEIPLEIRASLEDLMDTFDNHVNDNYLCGMDEGQSKLADKLCTNHLRESLTDVHRFMKKEWESTWSQRSDISVRIVTAVVTILVTIWGMFNRDLQKLWEVRLATSKTLLQQLDEILFPGISLLVTTTSTVQVTPSWIIFFAACSFAIFVFATVTFGVYVRMRYVERKEEVTVPA
ncbi:hypothetical protein SELMODRAFT_404651 [Selaginella moellendorffii]|uniref:Uncharacterized protein n=1 Tax=Selaginella moellendorffii TaxID=88036 RepID=D8QVZ8_SELML|nr:hypothetical protein SELMODRAFT_404651 [Selaginella moellendorffii]